MCRCKLYLELGRLLAGMPWPQMSPLAPSRISLKVLVHLKNHVLLVLLLLVLLVPALLIVVVGTLNQGYPLLQHEDAAPMRRPLATQGTTPDPTAWADQRAPRGKERQHISVRSDSISGTLDLYTYKSETPGRSEPKQVPGTRTLV
jgi:hypothetical protein